MSCWGSNQYGQLGSSAVPYSNVPLPVTGLGPTTQVAAGSAHSCALLVGGSVACWGANGSGQLGDGGTTASATPVPVTGITDAVQISVGNFHSCAVLLDGTTRCWGANGFGQLGIGSTTDSPAPVPVSGLTGIAEVAAGGEHTCARTGGGTVLCWGFNRYGQLGFGFAGETPITTPNSIPYFSATSISAGGAETCATVGSGVVTCWGANPSGQLGNGLTIDSPTPVPSFGIRSATQVTVGGAQACVLVTAGELECWGQNLSGQLGNGTERSEHPPTARRHGPVVRDGPLTQRPTAASADAACPAAQPSGGGACGSPPGRAHPSRSALTGAARGRPARPRRRPGRWADRGEDGPWTAG